jgi:hypothetical protein
MRRITFCTQKRVLRKVVRRGDEEDDIVHLEESPEGGGEKRR